MSQITTNPSPYLVNVPEFQNVITAATGSGVKTFVIDHPTDADKYLVHACLEGPEAAIYYRGVGAVVQTGVAAGIRLPAYAMQIGSQFTVHVTAILPDTSMPTMKPIVISATHVRADGTFSVVASESCEFSWFVVGRRKEIEVEPLKTAGSIDHVGPYTWFTANA